MITAEYSWYLENGEQCWMPIMNSWGCPYSLKGFAINKAKDMLTRWGSKNAHSYVLEQATSEIVWCSWDEEE